MARAPKQGLVDTIGSNRPQTAPAARKSSPTPPPAKVSGPSPMKYALILGFSVLMTFVFKETVLLLTIGMLPTGAAYLVDTHPRRYATKTVAWANFAGALIVAFKLWGTEVSFTVAFELLKDPLNWIIMLGAAAIGWGIHWFVPRLVLRYLSLSMEMNRRSLREKQKDLEKEWGTDVRANAPMDELASVEAGPEMEEDDPTLDDVDDPEEEKD